MVGQLRARVGGAWVDIAPGPPGPSGPAGPSGAAGTPGAKLVAVGSLLAGNPAPAANVWGNMTNPITFVTVTGHYYRIEMRIRAFSMPGAGIIRFRLSTNTGVFFGDHYLSLVPPYNGILIDWLFLGDGVSHSFVGMAVGDQNLIAYTDLDGHFYCQDLGVITGP